MYAANDCRDAIAQYDGTSWTSPATMPQGAVIEASKDRLIVADVASNPNGVYYSQSGTYTNFTTGINSADPYIDSVGSNGDKITALKYSYGSLYVFKTQSITYCNLKDQYASTCSPISNAIGTSDPLSIVDIPQGIAFRGNDNNFWLLDAGGLHPLSLKISAFVQTQTAGKVQSNTQTSQSDWQAGSQSPTGSWDTTSVPGSVFPSTAVVGNSSFTAQSGLTLVYTSTNEVSGQITLLRSTYSTTNGNLSQGNLNGWTITSSVNPKYYTDEFTGTACGPIEGATNQYLANDAGSFANSILSSSMTVYAKGGAIIKSCNVNFNGSCTYQSDTCDISASSGTVVSGDSIRRVGLNISNAQQYTGVYLGFKADTWDGTATTSTGTAANQVFASIGCARDGPSTHMGVKTCGTANYMPFGTATSKGYDTGYTSPLFGPLNMSISSGTNNTALSLTTKTSPDNSSFSSGDSITNGARIVSPQQRYVEWVATLTQTHATNGYSPAILSDSLSAAATGQFTTQCINPSSNISGWGIINCGETLAGAGSLSIKMSSATTCGGLASAAQYSQTNNSSITIDTAAAVEVILTSLLGSATDQAQLDSCTLYWKTGVVAPPSWGVYDSLKNSIYWTTSINNSATNNRLLKYDLNLNEWYPFDLSANALLRVTNAIYFGSSSSGKWNQYGIGNSDNGSAINAYWKSKDFAGSLPFLDKIFRRVSVVAKNQQAGTMTVTYAGSSGSSGSYSLSLAGSSSVPYVHANYSLPLLSPEQFMNFKFANNSSVPFEVDGLSVDFDPRPWMPKNP